MKFLTIDASKSMNPNTGESWYRAEAKVSLDENEVPEEVFAALKARLDEWLPNPSTRFDPEWNAPPMTANVKPAPPDKIQSFINTIQLCKTTANLERFRATVEREKNQQLTEAFEKKLKELQ